LVNAGKDGALSAPFFACSDTRAINNRPYILTCILSGFTWRVDVCYTYFYAGAA
jgi:hypothetical protein